MRRFIIVFSLFYTLMAQESDTKSIELLSLNEWGQKKPLKIKKKGFFSRLINSFYFTKKTPPGSPNLYIHGCLMCKLYIHNGFDFSDLPEEIPKCWHLEKK